MSTQVDQYSHPSSPVRHSYPLAVTDDSFSTALGLTMKTLPFVLLRLSILVGFTLVAIVWLAICGGVAYLFSGRDGGGGGFVLFLIGFGLPAGLFFWLRQYVLYMLKCAHVAVLTKLITHGGLPEGINQIEYGRKTVAEHFTQTNIMVVIDSLVTGTAGAFNRTLDWISNLIPIPGMESAMKFVHAIVNRATTFVDETILSYNLARGDENVWRSSMDGVVYYAANVKPILKTAVISVLIQYALTFGLFIVFLIPSWVLLFLLPASVSGFSWIFAAILAAAVRAAFLDPIFLTMVALTFHRNIQNQPISEPLTETLATLTNKFVQLRDKAREYVAPPKTSAPATTSS